MYGHPFVRFYVVDDAEAKELEVAAQLYEYVFAYSLVDLGDMPGFTKEHKLAQILSLDATPEELLATLPKNTQYKVRRTYRDEDVVVVVDDPARELSYEFYRTIKKASNVVPDIEEDFQSVRWINAYHQGDLVSSTSWFDSGVVLRGKHFVSTRKSQGVDTGLIGRLTGRLFWEACLLGIEEGRRFVDLAGVSLDDPRKRGITEFKQRFGGETVDVYVYRRSTEVWQDVVNRASIAGLTVP